MFDFPVQYVVYAYMYISLGLLVFNVLYMNGSPLRSFLHQYRTRRWTEYFYGRLRQDILHQTDQKLTFKLRNVRQLMAFSDALEEMELNEPDTVHTWLEAQAPAIYELALYYSHRESMERAYFAWFMARFRLIAPNDNSLIHVLISYLDNSTVYCRENVLKAAYSSGNIAAVDTTLLYFNDRHLYHSPKLLSDGLLTFTGDRPALARKLWAHHKQWDGDMMTAVVQFVTRMGAIPDLEASFLETMNDPAAYTELRMSLIRYFARHPHEAAKPYLMDYTLEKEQTVFAIASATALSAYPGDDTIAVLQKAVCSYNWYVRTNAASSLIALTRNHPLRAELLDCPDRYGRESIAYCLELEQRKGDKRQ